jgi:hypothetical protein
MHLNHAMAVLAFSSLVTASVAADRDANAVGADIAYRSGGFGQTEAQAMRDARRDYSLGLTFATREGAFLAGVDFEVRDASGQVVLQRQDEGPMVLVDLPPGRYTVRATAEGRERTHAFTSAGAAHPQVVLSW